MLEMLQRYQNSHALLKERIAAIHREMANSALTQPEADALERRRRLLCEEAHDLELVMEKIRPYLAEEVGDASCA